MASFWGFISLALCGTSTVLNRNRIKFSTHHHCWECCLPCCHHRQLVLLIDLLNDEDPQKRESCSVPLGRTDRRFYNLRLKYLGSLTREKHSTARFSSYSPSFLSSKCRSFIQKHKAKIPVHTSLRSSPCLLLLAMTEGSPRSH
jgi:hypothetical protein